uniref:WDFY family member 4 n=1 Tax=Rousettus aegyptiacus TaxID=9407 RepID=A0A7J8GJM3_ROUAE|nr:WDFY family member 4 [Rousettus aegyptiacus]
MGSLVASRPVYIPLSPCPRLPAPCSSWYSCSPYCLLQILVTFENLAAWGRCLCAVCPSPTTIVTSGASAVVCVWELGMAKGRPRGLHLKQALYGHTQAVTCLAASVTFSLLGTIVSCAGAHLSLWNVNGQSLASITTAWGPEGAITCCCVIEGPAWDTSHVIITGSQDGMVRVSVSWAE